MKTKLGPDVSCHQSTMPDLLARLREKRWHGQKLKVGVYGITGCAGCQLTILFSEKLPALLRMIDILALPFIKERNDKGRFDVILLEGLVASKEDKQRVKELRARCDVLVAIGACAVHGGVPAVRNVMDEERVEHAVYAKVDFLKSLKATPVSAHVPVDIELPGCPPSADQILAVLTDLVLGRPPRVTHNPVCVECVKREVDCLLAQGKPCLGLITTGGCDAICTVAGHECTGCRGPHPDANIPAYINLLEKKGFKRGEIERRLHAYAALAVDEQRNPKAAATGNAKKRGGATKPRRPRQERRAATSRGCC